MPRLIAILLIIFCSVLCCQSQPYLFVQLTSDDILFYKLAERPTVTYSGSELVVLTSSGRQDNIPIESIWDIQYTPPTNIAIRYNNISGLPMVFSVTGEYITTLKEPEDITTLNIPMGIYILRQNNSSQKFLLQ